MIICSTQKFDIKYERKKKCIIFKLKKNVQMIHFQENDPKASHDVVI